MWLTCQATQGYIGKVPSQNIITTVGKKRRTDRQTDKLDRWHISVSQKLDVASEDEELLNRFRGKAGFMQAWAPDRRRLLSTGNCSTSGSQQVAQSTQVHTG